MATVLRCCVIIIVYLNLDDEVLVLTKNNFNAIYDNANEVTLKECGWRQFEIILFRIGAVARVRERKVLKVSLQSFSGK
jgi:hypothetical protein